MNGLVRLSGVALILGTAIAWGQTAPAQTTQAVRPVPQVWEKMVRPGLTYRMEVDPAGPLVIHAFRWSMGSVNLSLRPELARLKVYDTDASRGRDVLTSTMVQAQALAGVNAGFFGPSGDPLGAQVVGGEIVSLPWPNRTAFAWGSNGTTLGRFGFEGVVKGRGSEVTIDGVNQSANNDTLVVNTTRAGLALSGGPEVTHVVLRTADPLRSGREVRGIVSQVVTGQPSYEIGAGEMVLTGAGVKRTFLGRLQVGDTVTVSARVTGVDTNRFPNVIGCGNELLTDGRPTLRWREEGFSEAFSEGRHPRTAIGSTPTGEVWLVIVEGRQKMSVGATLAELAVQMQRLGCDRAIALDGGGSSTLALGGVALNRPSDGQERMCANFLLLFSEGDPSAEDDKTYTIRVPQSLAVGSATELAILDPDGKVVPDAEVFWSAMGAAWVDQGGILRALEAGEVRISVWVRGHRVTGTLTVTAAPESGG